MEYKFDYQLDIKGKVTIKANGKEIDKPVTISKSTPIVDKLELQPFNNLTIKEGILHIPGTTGTVPIDSTDLVGVLKVIDQYGEDITFSVTGGIKMTATDLVNSDNDNTIPEVSGNGTSTLQFSGMETGDSFKLTYIVDEKSLTTKVIVQ